MGIMYNSYFYHIITCMENINKLLIQNFKIIISKLEDGTSYIGESELESLLELTSNYANNMFSKYQAAQYLNVSTKTFDNYVRDGFIPKGKKIPGHRELSWSKKDLDNYIKKARQ